MEVNWEKITDLMGLLLLASPLLLGEAPRLSLPPAAWMSVWPAAHSFLAQCGTL